MREEMDRMGNRGTEESRPHSTGRTGFAITTGWRPEGKRSSRGKRSWEGTATEREATGSICKEEREYPNRANFQADMEQVREGVVGTETRIMQAAGAGADGSEAAEGLTAALERVREAAEGLPTLIRPGFERTSYQGIL